MIKLLSILDDLLEAIEGILMSLLLIGLVILSFLQIFLRNFNLMGGSISWGNPMIGVLVLWIGFMGASIATKKKNHIKFEVFTRFLPFKLKRFTEFLVFLPASGICSLFALNSYNYLLEFVKPDGKMKAPFLPEWVALSIIPIGFSLMGIRFLFRGLGSLGQIFFQPSKVEGAH